jgi:hypothetical protein
MYGGGIRTSRSAPKTPGAKMTKLESINPKPSDGTQDYNVKMKKKNKKDTATNFDGFSFYVMTDTPVSQA